MSVRVRPDMPPSELRLRYAQALDAAISEAGYPVVEVDVYERGCGVQMSLRCLTTGEGWAIPHQVVERAYAVTEHLHQEVLGRGE